MNRRHFLALGAAGLASRATPAAADRPRRFVTSDAAPLTRVLVHAPGPETQKLIPLGGGDHPMLAVDLMGEEAAHQHRAFVGLLTQAGAEVLSFAELLDDAIARARAAEAFGPWLVEAAPQLVDLEPKLDAAALIGAVDEYVYHKGPEGEGFRPLTDPLKFLYFTRDTAVMTPRGVLICNFVNQYRAYESALTRFVFDWASALRRYPVALDAHPDRFFVQGGDVIVADEDTLFVGVGNLTEEAAARRLAQKLNMNVVSVELPGGGTAFRRGGSYDSWNSLRTQFLHLDTIFNFVAPRSVLAIPYFLEMEHVGTDPLTEMLQGLSTLPRINKAYFDQMVTSLTTVGLVKRYKAKTGALDPTVKGMKLVDYLRQLGYQIYFVGGAIPEQDATKHTVERVLREIRFQGGNVLAMGPNRLIAAEGNKGTLDGLKAAGVEVATFRADDLTRWHGGPHCMAMPLERREHRRQPRG
jgi:arginine deiminase